MGPDRWRRVEELYHTASLLETDERGRFLRASCGADDALRTEVESLLAYQGRAEAFIEGPALDVAARLLASEEPPAEPSLSGSTLASFHILEKLGEGGMGVVYEAEDTRLGRKVALKFLPATVAGDPHALERFRREARAASALNHPNICTIYSVQEHAGRPFIEMERLEGEPLRERIAAGPLEMDTVVALAGQMTDGLAAAHAKGIVHRDLKPGNVFITARGAKLLDFGLAKLESAPAAPERRRTPPGPGPLDASLTDPGSVLGTAAYMSPEQARGEDVDWRTDLFSLGAVLYEMATGCAPFGGPSSAATRDAILSQEPRPPREVNPAVPADLEAIVLKALRKDRGLRYQHASEMHADLERLRRDLDPAGAAPVTRASRPRWVWALGAAAALFLLLVARLALQPSALSSGALDIARMRVRQLTHNSSENSVGSSAISPDGRYVAYTDRTGIQVRTIATGEMRRVPPSENPPAPGAVWDLAPGWFPDGTRFVANLRANEEATADSSSVWVVGPAGGPRKLRDGAEAYSVSPDGSWIAFGVHGAARGTREVWRMGADGGEAQELFEAADGGSLAAISWSPDGRRVAYLRADGSGRFTAIETRDLAGGSPAPVVQVAEGEALWGILWLRDGRLLYAIGQASADTSAGTFNCSHWQVRIDDRTGRPVEGPSRIAQWQSQCVGNLSVTADAHRAVFLQWAFQDVIHVADLEPGGARITVPTRLTLSEGRNIPSGWTADGRAVVFVSDGRGPAALFRQPIDGETPELLAQEPGITGAARLTPDAASVLYVALVRPSDPAGGQRLMRVPVSGGASQEVLRGEFVDGGARCSVRPSDLCAIAERRAFGRRLVFTAVEGPEGRGRELARLDIVPGGDYRWALAPDGSRLAVLDARAASIRLLSLAGEPPRSFDVAGWRTLGYVSWTADGQRLLVPSLDARGAPLLSVDLAGNATVLWEQKGSLGTSAIPSPDGRRLAIWTRGRSGNLWMADRP
jgi:serine/threonine protein kinase